MIAILSGQINRLLLVMSALPMAACATNTATSEKDDVLLEATDTDVSIFPIIRRCLPNSCKMVKPLIA